MTSFVIRVFADVNFDAPQVSGVNGYRRYYPRFGKKMVCVFGGFRVANEVTALPLITNHSCMLGDQRRVLEPTVRMIPCIDSCSKCRDSSVVNIAAMTCADVLRRSEVVRRLFCD